jgi:hypothetical protein
MGFVQNDNLPPATPPDDDLEGGQDALQTALQVEEHTAGMIIVDEMPLEEVPITLSAGGNTMGMITVEEMPLEEVTLPPLVQLEADALVAARQRRGYYAVSDLNAYMREIGVDPLEFRAAIAKK